MLGFDNLSGRRQEEEEEEKEKKRRKNIEKRKVSCLLSLSFVCLRLVLLRSFVRSSFVVSSSSSSSSFRCRAPGFPARGPSRSVHSAHPGVGGRQHPAQGQTLGRAKHDPKCADRGGKVPLFIPTLTRLRREVPGIRKAFSCRNDALA